VSSDPDLRRYWNDNNEVEVRGTIQDLELGQAANMLEAVGGEKD